MQKQHVFDQYLRTEKLPHIFCPGCGNGIIISSVIRAIDRTGIDQNQVVLVAGIGCSSRSPGYMDFCGIQTNHGRALAYATGIKMHNPNLHVIVLTGDGDCTSIGGNHFIHAARRNIDLTTIVFNNNNYGMTGGQFSPTTPAGSKTRTTVYGNIDPSFDISELARAAGATYVARSTTYHVTMLIDQIEKAILHKGFSVIEVMCDCPTLYGRLNKKGDAVDMMLAHKENSVTVNRAKTMTDEELEGKVIIGEIVNNTKRPEYTQLYEQVINTAGEGK
jgi:2-oxoglutarate ferredoxin oxidoreductase subunit beta